MDGKLGTFLLGIIAAAVLFLMWDNKGKSTGFSFASMMPTPAPQSNGCASCGASPAVQSDLESTGTAGIIPPPGVPLGSPVAGGATTSIYTAAGQTPDTSFTFGPSQTTPGSPTVPAATTPVRATQSVAPYSQGFHQHTNILGVPVKGYVQ
jgi:hypothetical protein